jgi:hypothetical protein
MTKLLRISLFIVILAFVSGFAECYKPVTKNQLPARIKTVAVPAFQMESQALRYKVESRFTEAVMRELVHRGRGLRVQGQREGADAVIEGVIKSFNFGGVLLDDKGRARILTSSFAVSTSSRAIRAASSTRKTLPFCACHAVLRKASCRRSSMRSKSKRNENAVSN